MKIKPEAEALPDHLSMMEWQTATSAHFGRDLELAVINAGEVHALVFPCRRVLRGWIKAQTKAPVRVRPTHWRKWEDSNSALFSLDPALQRGSEP
jgi:hypothetical protein